MLSGTWTSLGLSAGALCGQRVALPIAALLLGWKGNVAAALLLGGAAALGIVRALATDWIAVRLRRNILDFYLEPFERAPAAELPSADVIGTRVALAFPTFLTWAVQGVAGVVAGAVAVPIAVAVLATTLGPSVLLPLGLAGAVGALSTVFVAPRLEEYWHRAWLRSRSLLMRLFAGYRGALELRAHGRAETYADELREELEGWSRQDGRARRFQALANWGGLALTLAVAVGFVPLFAPGLVDELTRDAESRYRAWLLVLSAVPALQTAVAGVVNVVRARDELEGVAAHRVSLLPDPLGPEHEAEAALVDPRAEIRFEEVTFTYPHEHGEQTRPALDGLSLVIPSGASVALVGRNGAGKTTLLRLLLGLVRPEAGQILVDGRAIAFDAHAWRDRIAFLSQRPLELDDGSVEDNLRVFAPDAPRVALVQALADVGLWDTLRARVTSDDAALELPYEGLSRGESRRVLLARTLAREAELVVLDEPEANLDAKSVAQLADVLERLSKRRRIIAAIHQRSAMPWAERVIELEAGQARVVEGSDEPGGGN